MGWLKQPMRNAMVRCKMARVGINRTAKKQRRDARDTAYTTPISDYAFHDGMTFLNTRPK